MLLQEAIIYPRMDQVTAVAHVLSVQANPTNNVFELGDGTGRIEARHWVDASTDGDEEKTNGVTWVFPMTFKALNLIRCLETTCMQESPERSSNLVARNILISHISSQLWIRTN